MVQETTSNGTDPLNDPAIGAKSFGFKNVSEDDKQEMVDEVFHSVARKYDIMNDMMSAGMHRLWKEALVSAINPPKSGAAYRHLDVAGGTGDIAFQVVERSHKHAQSTVFDINGSMLAVGAERAEKRKLSDNVEFVEGNAEELPFEDRTFDVYTVAFGIRNVPRRDKALEEAYRVLKRGGRLFVLEFAPVDMPFFNKVYETYSFNVIPEIGRMITGDAESYRYLVESIAKFPPPKRFEKLIEAAGFENVSHRLYTAGIACLHSGWKL